MTRLLGNVAGVLAAGLLLTAVTLLPTKDGILCAGGRRLVSHASVAAAGAAAATLAQAVWTLSDVLGIPPGDALSPSVWGVFVTQITLGRSLAVQAILALAAAAVALSARTTRGAFPALLLALGAAVLPALGGHAAAEQNHVLAVVSLGVHLLAATLWIGGLSGLTLVACGNRPSLGEAVPRYSHLALWCAVAVLASGILNGSLRIGDLETLVLSSYGTVLLAKVAAFGLLAGLGWWHRRRTVPQLAALGASRRSPEGSTRPEPKRRSPAAQRAFVRLAAIELLIMAGTYGLAVGLSRTPPPAQEPQGVRGWTSAEALLGYPLPEAPSIPNLLGIVHADAFGLTFATLSAALYLTGVRTLRRRGDAWPPVRTAMFLTGVTAVLIVTCTGVGRYAPALFSVHMVQHMTLNMVAPLLLAAGAPITLALRALPLRDRRTVMAIVRSAPARFFAHPLVATGIFVVSLYGLYFTPLFEAAMRNHWGHLAMQAHFLASGFLFFWFIIGVDPDPQRPSRLARIPLLLAVMLTHTVFSVVLVFGAAVIGQTYYTELNHPWAAPLLEDQALGGAITWLLGELVIVAVLAALILQWFDAAERADQARARVHNRARPAPPA